MDALELIRKPIEEDLKCYRELFLESLSHENPLLDFALTHLAKRPGKMMRPILTLLAARSVGKVDERVLHAAVSLELLHTASLVHDDVLDKSDRRRGQASVNGLIDNQAAVLVGDFLLSRSLQHAAATGDIRVVNLISGLGQTLADGELLQIANMDNEVIDEESYYRVIERKTASLFAVSAQIGCLLGGGSEEDIDRMRTFGMNLGLCFQMKDDIFDYDSKHDVGKPSGVDMREGKLTLPVIYSVNTEGAESQYQLALRVRKGEFTESDIQELVDFTHERGGIAYTYQQMELLSQKSAGILAFVSDAEIAASLSAYVRFISSRDI